MITKISLGGTAAFNIRF